jgi:hypothetical protein
MVFGSNHLPLLTIFLKNFITLQQTFMEVVQIPVVLAVLVEIFLTNG